MRTLSITHPPRRGRCLAAQPIPPGCSGQPPRPQQLAMAEAVEAAIGGPHHLMVEAGTGVGKTFAYLVPAILHATEKKDFKVVISTHTISLQEQLIHKDIPFLHDIMGREFSAVL